MRITLRLTYLIFMLSFCGCGKSPSPKASLSAPDVEVATVRMEMIPDRRSFIGRISGNYEAVIQPRVSGHLLSRHFESGMPVKRGELLFVIDAELLRTTLLSARAALESARAKEVEAKNNYERAVPLAEISAISQAQLDQYRAQYRAAKANVRTSEQQLRNATLEVGYSRIYSPIDGFVEAPKAHVGDYVGVGTDFSVLTKVTPHTKRGKQVAHSGYKDEYQRLEIVYAQRVLPCTHY